MNRYGPVSASEARTATPNQAGDLFGAIYIVWRLLKPLLIALAVIACFPFVAAIALVFGLLKGK